MKKLLDLIKKHPLLSQAVICLVAGIIAGTLWGTYNSIEELIKYNTNPAEIIVTFFASIVVFAGIFSVIVFPLVVTVYEAIYLVCTLISGKTVNNSIISFFVSAADGINTKVAALYDLFVIALGSMLELIQISVVHDIILDAQWFVELKNQQLHAPIAKEGMVTFVVLLSMFIAGLVTLTLIPAKKRAPLITVLSISSMYIGVIEAVLFTIHLAGMNIKGDNGVIHYKFTPDLSLTFLIPLNLIMILIRMMVREIRAFEIDENRMSKINSVPVLSWCNKVLLNSKNWPVAALIMMVPLLACIIIVLVLFGQAPDDAIKAFTETANYTFSTKIPPQNVFYDEHYLCTVAAGGHEKIVKPVRMGKRHGHDVVVNRQLLIANAFEQILEEKTPGFHRRVRNFYDKYGFPISRLIRSKYVADIIWFIMKPLEWLFLIVIYSVDANPEDRISSQYL